MTRMYEATFFYINPMKKICDPLDTRQSVNMKSTRCHRRTEVHVVQSFEPDIVQLEFQSK